MIPLGPTPSVGRCSSRWIPPMTHHAGGMHCVPMQPNRITHGTQRVGISNVLEQKRKRTGTSSKDSIIIFVRNEESRTRGRPTPGRNLRGTEGDVRSREASSWNATSSAWFNWYDWTRYKTPLTFGNGTLVTRVRALLCALLAKLFLNEVKRNFLCLRFLDSGCGIGPR
jgi:hypothetical protein